MTQRHARYLAQYPQKIALKRLKRRRVAGNRTQYKRTFSKRLRRTLMEYMQTRPNNVTFRPGRATLGQRIKSFFNKSPV